MRSFRVDIPPTSAGARDRARSLLDARLGPSKVLTSPEACERFARDESEAEGPIPDAVVLATSTDDIAAALAVAAEAGVPITPRAAGTGRSGGAVPVAGGIVLATLGMSGIKAIDRREGVAVVEPGVVLADLHRAVTTRTRRAVLADDAVFARSVPLLDDLLALRLPVLAAAMLSHARHAGIAMRHRATIRRERP